MESNAWLRNFLLSEQKEVKDQRLHKLGEGLQALAACLKNLLENAAELPGFWGSLRSPKAKPCQCVYLTETLHVCIQHTREGGTITKYDKCGLFVHYKITKTVNCLKIPWETKTWSNGSIVRLQKCISNKNI